MHADTDIITALDSARAAGIDADLSTECGMIRTGVDGEYRFFGDWPAAVADLAERVAAAVAERSPQ